tara:strand:+ start:89 stop:280 length:192 start_codon:yes stop_codon:yes gene_type:complete
MDKDALIDIVVELVETGEDTSGVCTACHEIAYGVEPDAERYTCESCGEQTVYGAEQWLLLNVP